MKARIIFRIALFLLLMLPISSNAQMIRDSEGWAVIPLNVNGLHLYGKYTKAQIIKALGKPIKFKESHFEDEKMATWTFIYSNNDSFGFDDGRFVDMRLRSSNFHVNKIVKVGCSTDCVYEMIKELGNRAGLLEKKTLSKGEKYFSLQLAPGVDGYIHIYCTDWVRGYITEIEFYSIL